MLDQCPATAEVLEEIVKEVNGSMKILVDGGIRSGTDIFKALALGADGVLICRPFVVAVYGGGEEGVKLYIDKLGAELKDAMQMCGAHSVSEITRDMVRYYQDKIKAIKAKRDEEIRDIFTGKSDKFVVIIGPCSADNEDSVCEYVNKLAKLNDRVSDKLMIIPRIYTNKPRTTGEGYKGMLHQPDPEQAPDLLAGIIAIRKMHIRAMQETYLTAADEMLYPENRSYLDDILSYEAIGARSVENQQHRLTASGMDIPIGMKNPTSGDLSVMLNSVVAAQGPHRFIYRGQDVTTDGNDLAHVILRGGVDKYGTTIPNYHYEDCKRLLNMYEQKNLKNPAVIIDANHSNSNKQYKEQLRIVSEVLHTRNYDPKLKKLIKGVMVESYLVEGRQDIGGNMVYGKSITDPCIGWEDTVRLIDKIAEDC